MSIFVCLLNFISEIKFEFISISGESLIFKSPSLIFKKLSSPKIFFINTSDLSAKKSKFVLVKIKFSKVFALKFEKDPLAIKSLNKLFSSKKFQSLY